MLPSERVSERVWAGASPRAGGQNPGPSMAHPATDAGAAATLLRRIMASQEAGEGLDRRLRHNADSHASVVDVDQLVSI